MNSKELKKFLEAQKLQTYYLLNKNESFVFFNGIAKFKMKYNEDNILLSKNLNYPNSAYAQYDETPNLWLSLAEQMKLQYLEEYKTNKLNMILFLVNSNLVLLRTEAKERLIKAEANLQLEDEQIYKIDKKFIPFFAEDLALWISSEVSPNKIEHELYDELKDDFVYEDDLLALILIKEKFAAKIVNLPKNPLHGENRNQIFEIIRNNDREKLKKFENYVKILLLKADERYGEIKESADKEIGRLVDKVKMQKLLEQKAILDSKLETAEINGDENLKREIIAQIIELNKELNSGKR